MTLRFLLDTNILSEPLRPQPNAQILHHLAQYEQEIAIAAVVWHELWFGCNRLPQSAKRNAIETYLLEVVAPTIPILPYDENAAAWQAAERARLTNTGVTPSFADGQIAATARVNGLTLVTANTADYAPFKGIEIVDWRV